MSGVQKFLEKRGSSSARDDILQDPEQTQRLNARMREMGIPRSLNGVQEANFNERNEDRPLSRQAIAERARVTVPVYNPQFSGPIPTSHAPRQPIPNTRATNSHQAPVQSFSHSTVKPLGAFDTDTEGLDDTTSFNGLHDPAVPISELRDGMTGRFTTEDEANDFETAQATPKPRAAKLRRSMASPRSKPPTDIGDADDEFDDQSEFPDFVTNEVVKWNDYRPVGAGPQNHGKAIADEVSNQKIHSPKPLLGNGRPVFSGALPHDPHVVSSTRNSSISSNEIPSKKKRDGSWQPPAMNDHPTDLVGHDGRGLDVTKTKEEPTPSQTVGANIASTDLKRKLNPANPQPNLDYDPKTLAKMSFQQLAEESFNTSPHATPLRDRSLTNASSLQEKLLYLHSLDGPSDQIRLQRQAFFSSLPIDQYEECGDVMTEHFGQLISRFKQARQRKRAVAKGFEDEIAARERLVERGKVAVATESDRLKRAGRDVVGGR
ncbi:MAG: hypothetical protein LQ350_002213 [Teloschistes chrysophthalmus]|nr:MAG: hypothetical protein LQ350_002213 [Niorma chrysophthalma]